jgi:branched-chain amino acid transport system ATP-binding protein
LSTDGLTDSDIILRLNSVEVMYHEVILVLKGVSIDVPRGGIVALLGANGAGKSTTLKSISGLLKHEDGEVTDGSIEFRRNRQARHHPDHRGQKGL